MSKCYSDSFPYYVRAEDEKQFLRVPHGEAYWSPDAIDYAFSTEKDTKKLEISHFTQEALEYFVLKYGKEYEYLYFNGATRIKDLSPLGNLTKLKGISIDQCRADSLWDMRSNPSLTSVWLASAKRLTYTLTDIETCKSLEAIMISGDMYSPHLIRTFSCLADLPRLKRIELLDIKCEDHDPSFLKALPSLEEFHFDAGMLSTEEIAYICAKHPNLKGRSLGAYTTEFTVKDVRICGYRKPSLYLPEEQERLNHYIKEFEALVEKYRKN